MSELTIIDLMCIYCTSCKTVECFDGVPKVGIRFKTGEWICPACCYTDLPEGLLKVSIQQYCQQKNENDRNEVSNE